MNLGLPLQYKVYEAIFQQSQTVQNKLKWLGMHSLQNSWPSLQTAGLDQPWGTQKSNSSEPFKSWLLQWMTNVHSREEHTHREVAQTRLFTNQREDPS